MRLSFAGNQVKTEDHVLKSVSENMKFVNLTGLNITEIGAGVFEGCDIEHIKLPDGVTVIQDRAFANCVNLITVELPASLKEIGEEAFAFCENLRSISPLPLPIGEIPESAFRGCISLEI